MRLALGYATVTLLLLGIAAPVMGAVDAPSARIEMNQIVVQAEADMDMVLNRFTAEAIAASTQEELEAVRRRAVDDVVTIRDRALAAVDALLAEFPDELAADAAAARRRINDAAIAAIAEINSISSDIAGSLPPSTTTTTTTSTTTTTTPSAGATTTTTVVSVGPPHSPPPGPAPTIDDPAAGYAMSPPPPLDPGDVPATAPSGTERSMATSALVGGMSVVVPPAVATAVLSLPIVLEVLIGTVLSSVGDLLVPTAILLAAAGFLARRELKYVARGRPGAQPPM